MLQRPPPSPAAQLPIGLQALADLSASLKLHTLRDGLDPAHACSSALCPQHLYDSVLHSNALLT